MVSSSVRTTGKSITARARCGRLVRLPDADKREVETVEAYQDSEYRAPAQEGRGRVVGNYVQGRVDVRVRRSHEDSHQDVVESGTNVQANESGQGSEDKYGKDQHEHRRYDSSRFGDEPGQRVGYVRGTVPYLGVLSPTRGSNGAVRSVRRKEIRVHRIANATGSLSLPLVGKRRKNSVGSKKPVRTVLTKLRVGFDRVTPLHPAAPARGPSLRRYPQVQ